MAGVLRTAQKAAGSTIPVLIEGESGVGKELLPAPSMAAASASQSRSSPSIAARSPTISLELILFGHEKGAFTGATERHMGKFVEAHGGTLFLDEVSELPLAAQVKLLRALQEGAVEAVGGRKPVKVDVRIISRYQPQVAGPRQKRSVPRGPVLSPARAAVDHPAIADAARGYPGSASATAGAPSGAAPPGPVTVHAGDLLDASLNSSPISSARRRSRRPAGRLLKSGMGVGEVAATAKASEAKNLRSLVHGSNSWGYARPFGKIGRPSELGRMSSE